MQRDRGSADDSGSCTVLRKPESTIDLIVRGQCTLVPGLRGISSRIHVRSIVGRFLEHSRIFYFENGGEPEVYLGSADWMPRNLYERVEVLFPLRDPRAEERICKEILPAYLADNRKARILGADGIYTRAPRADEGQRVFRPATPDGSCRACLLTVRERSQEGSCECDLY